MDSTTRFAVQPLDKGKGRLIAASNGNPTPTGTLVDGVAIDYQAELQDGGFVVVLSEDSPYDEGLHVYLLRRDFTVEDALEAGAPMGLGVAGIFRAVGVGKGWLEFEFFTTGPQFRLTVEASAVRRWRLPEGFRYKKLFQPHRLIVETVRGDGENDG